MRSLAIPALVCMALAAACGSERLNGEPLPACGPAGATGLAFAPDSVTATAYPGGPQPTGTPPESGFRIDATAGAAQLDLYLVRFDASARQVTCTTSLHGSYTGPGGPANPIAALVTVDSAVAPVAKGRVVRVWLTGTAGVIATSSAYSYEGPFLVP